MLGMETSVDGARGLPFIKVVSGAAGSLDLGTPGERRLIYRTWVTLSCINVEKPLFPAGEAVLHDPFFHYAKGQLSPAASLKLAGPQTAPCKSFVET